MCGRQTVEVPVQRKRLAKHHYAMRAASKVLNITGSKLQIAKRAIRPSEFGFSWKRRVSLNIEKNLGFACGACIAEPNLLYLEGLPALALSGRNKNLHRRILSRRATKRKPGDLVERWFNGRATVVELFEPAQPIAQRVNACVAVGWLPQMPQRRQVPGRTASRPVGLTSGFRRCCAPRVASLEDSGALLEGLATESGYQRIEHLT